MKKFFKEFKDFISKGNILDLAVAVIIGATFNAIISSLVQNVIMPVISIAIGGINVADWKWVITVADEAAGIKETAVYYGLFIQSLLDFIIIAFCVFLAIKLILRLKTELGKINDYVLSKEDRLEMKKLGLNPRKKQDILKYKAQLPKEEVEKEEVKPTEIDLLQEIRDLLKESQNIISK